MLPEEEAGDEVKQGAILRALLPRGFFLEVVRLKEPMRKSILSHNGQTWHSLLNAGLLLFALCFFPPSAVAAETPRRIVSLAPGMTELLYAIGI